MITSVIFFPSLSTRYHLSCKFVWWFNEHQFSSPPSIGIISFIIFLTANDFFHKEDPYSFWYFCSVEGKCINRTELKVHNLGSSVCSYVCPLYAKSAVLQLSCPVALTRAGLVPTCAHTLQRWEFKATKKKRKNIFFLITFLVEFLFSFFLVFFYKFLPQDIRRLVMLSFVHYFQVKGSVPQIYII